MNVITAEDINRYITIIRINFENAYKVQTKEERQLLLQSWHACLKQYPKEVCDKAVFNVLARAKFAPRIGDITEEIERMCKAFDKSEQELWSELQSVLREVERCIYAFKFTYIDETGLSQGEQARLRVDEIFNQLSPEIKEYLQNKSGLCTVALETAEQLQFEKARFIKTIPTLKDRAKTRQATPASLSILIKGILGNERDDLKRLQ